MRKKTCVSRIRFRTDTGTQAGAIENYASHRDTPETLSDDDVEIVPDSYGEKDTHTKKHRLIETDGASISSEDACFICGILDGQLLVCQGTDCPILVHENCLDNEPDYDDQGDFLCPYCWYKKVIENLRALREKAMEAKKSLSQFLGSEVTFGIKGFENNVEVGSNKGLATKDHQGSMKDNKTDRTEVSNGAERLGVGHSESDVEKRLHCKHEDLEKDKAANQLKSTYGGEWAQQSHSKEVTHGEATDLQRPGVIDFDKPVNQAEMRIDAKVVEAVDEAKNQPGERCHDFSKDEDRLADDSTSVSMEEACSAKGLEGDRENAGSKEQVQLTSRENSTSSIESPDDCSMSSSRDQTFEIRLRQRLVRQTSEREASQQSFHSKKPLTASAVKHKANQRRKFVSPKISPLKRKTQIASNELSRNQRRKGVSLTVSSAERKSIVVSSARRKRLSWAPEEERVLREGVEKYSSMANKNFPWRKVLEFGQRVFHITRTPTDLKDKWRNMMKGF